MAWILGKRIQKMVEVKMKKLIPLILLTALVGCGYDSFEECRLKEFQKMENAGGSEMAQVSAVNQYCARYKN